MAIIGTFVEKENGFTGAIKTLGLDVKVKFVRTQKDNDKGPDFRVLVGRIEFGAAWKKTGQNGRDYLSVRLEDPNFSAPIFANLVEGNEAIHTLIWSRCSGE